MTRHCGTRAPAHHLHLATEADARLAKLLRATLDSDGVDPAKLDATVHRLMAQASHMAVAAAVPIADITDALATILGVDSRSLNDDWSPR